jgi:hypothetical protein
LNNITGREPSIEEIALFRIALPEKIEWDYRTEGSWQFQTIQIHNPENPSIRIEIV